MAKSILTVESSMRTEGSQSRILTQKLLEQFQQTQPVVRKKRDLADGIPLINQPWI